MGKKRSLITRRGKENVRHSVHGLAGPSSVEQAKHA